MLGFLDSGFRNFANTEHPVREPADLKGLKIRTPPIPVIIETMKALGAQAIPFAQVYTSLQSHVVDEVEPVTTKPAPETMPARNRREGGGEA
jgi:TRAP-type transport system periplasmic protein